MMMKLDLMQKQIQTLEAYSRRISRSGAGEKAKRGKERERDDSLDGITEQHHLFLPLCSHFDVLQAARLSLSVDQV